MILIIEIAAGVVIGGLVLNFLLTPAGNTFFQQMFVAAIAIGTCVGVVFAAIWAWQYETARLLIKVVGIAAFTLAPSMYLQSLLQRKYPYAKPIWDPPPQPPFPSWVPPLRLGMSLLYFVVFMSGMIISMLLLFPEIGRTR